MSVWLDQIRRSLVEGGELARMVAEESLRGVTANPSIFEKAILGSKDYDDELEELRPGPARSPRTIYERIAIRDVQEAADVLAAVHREAGRAGRIRLAGGRARAGPRHRGHAGPARTYWKRLDRPNVMIKIPGTPEGVAGDRAGDLRGHQHQRHAAVRGRGLRKGRRGVHPRTRAAFGRREVGRHPLGGELLCLPSGHALDRRSSSRAETTSPARLPSPTLEPLTGASRRSSRASAGSGSRTPGAAVQRPALGLDGHQEPLLPRHQVRRRADRAAHGQHDAAARRCSRSPTTATCHGRVPPSRTPTGSWKRWPRPGIDIQEVTEELLVDGVKQFEEAMSRLLAGIEEACAAVITGPPPTIQAAIPTELQPAIAGRVRRALEETVAQRVWRHDPSLWGGPGVPEIEDRLGWLTVSETMLEYAPELHRFADSAAARGLHPRGAARAWVGRRWAPR